MNKMRVTQTMLSMNTLRHINQGYERLGKLQDQLASQKKITRAHQDPVVAMNGMRYRTQVTEVDQFKRNLAEVYNWMDSADSALDITTQALHRIRELTVQASNDTFEPTQRANIAKEIEQLRAHIESMANTKANNKYIFNGANTMNAPVDTSKMNISVGDLPNYENGQLEVSFNGKVFQFDHAAGDTHTFVNGLETITIDVATNTVTHTSPDPKSNTTPPAMVSNSLKDWNVTVSQVGAVSTNRQAVEIEILKGVTLPVNVTPQNIFSNALFGDIIRLENALKDPSTKGEDLTKLISNFDKHIDQFVAERAELGARINRVEMVDSRLMEQEVIARRIMSNNEDVDIERTIVDLMTQESVHRAALSAGARIMQPTLLDFLR
ncbi:flagellar hook-associated protein FlgL [Alkalihalobacterium elongatum]|uniref:flagellar hook-associated protein FlgL n=1 Tax=Alkalihalobacterium elongatum TaxID=2675466 RepID=UPI002E29270C|nr:flagellar hook-associated protein FlgL [Alkalihalobacterium elongatum]